MSGRYPAGRTPAGRSFGAAMFRLAISYGVSCANVISRTLSLNRQIVNYVGGIVSEESNVLNRQLINYVGNIITLIDTISFLRRRLLGSVTKTSGLIGIMRRR